MDKWQGKVAVVTGASSGIGEEICKQLIERGMIVVGFARREEKLRELQNRLKEKQGKFYYVIVDICSEKNIVEAFDWVNKTLKSVDVLVNNAGILTQSNILGNTEDWKKMFDTNVIGLSICCKEAIKIMEKTKTPSHVININSISGHQVFSEHDFLAIYGSTKHAVKQLTEYMRCLMTSLKLPIRITSISPGMVDTDMTSQFNYGGKIILQTSDIADTVIYALSVPQRVNISEIILHPILNKLIIK